MECIIKNCKNKFGGYIDVSKEERGEFMTGRMPFCKEHFKKVYAKCKEIERKTLKKNQGWAYMPYDKFLEALNS